MNKNLNIRIYSLFLLCFGVFLCYLLLVRAIIPIWSIENNEQDKKKVIGMQQSAPTEFTQEGNSFWWLENKKNYLWFTNDSDEAIRGTINLYFSQNPCGANTDLLIYVNEIWVENFQLNSSISKASIKVNKLEPFSTLEVSIYPAKYTQCNLNNGDIRQLVGKLENWSFE
jgi:hypothetical protein